MRLPILRVSLAGQFVRGTSSPSPNILNSRWTFHSKMSSEYQTFCWTFCPTRSNSFAGHFQNSWRISRTLYYTTSELTSLYIYIVAYHLPRGSNVRWREDMSGGLSRARVFRSVARASNLREEHMILYQLAD